MSENKVNVNWQAVFAFIPIVSLWAYIRIEKFWLGFLLNFCLGFIPFVLMGIGMMIDQTETLGLGMSLLFVGIGFMIYLKIHYIRKWSREWNEKNTEDNEV